MADFLSFCKSIAVYLPDCFFRKTCLLYFCIEMKSFPDIFQQILKIGAIILVGIVLCYMLLSPLRSVMSMGRKTLERTQEILQKEAVDQGTEKQSAPAAKAESAARTESAVTTNAQIKTQTIKTQDIKTTQAKSAEATTAQTNSLKNFARKAVDKIIVLDLFKGMGSPAGYRKQNSGNSIAANFNKEFATDGTAIPRSSLTSEPLVPVTQGMELQGGKAAEIPVTKDRKIIVSDAFAKNGQTSKRAAKYDYRSVKVSGFEMVLVEGGDFVMGASREQSAYAGSDEVPPHHVNVKSFMMGEHEVTQQQWEELMGSNPSHMTGKNYPVDGIGYSMALEFISRLNEVTGRKFRLPTEEEWEYAARGGRYSRGCLYAGSDMLDEIAWTRKNSEKEMHPVGTLLPNELGLYDMSGNVREWCSSGYYIYSDNNDGKKTALRVLRGGSSISDTDYCRVAARYVHVPGGTDAFCGLRLACDI